MNNVQANIILVSLNENFGKIVSNLFAEQFSMNFINCRDELAEDIANNKILLSHFTMADLENREESVLANCIERKNAVLFLPYDLYRRNKLLFNGQTIIYLRLDKRYLSEKDVISSVSFTTRDEYLKNYATKVIRLDSLDDKVAVQKIKGEIK